MTRVVGPLLCLVALYLGGIALSTLALGHVDAVRRWTEPRGIQHMEAARLLLQIGMGFSSTSGIVIGFLGWRWLEIRKVLRNQPIGSLTMPQVLSILGGFGLLVVALVAPDLLT